MKRYSIFLIISVLLLSLSSVFIFTNNDSHSQQIQIPPPPPVPVQIIPSIVEDIRNTKHNLSSLGPAGRTMYTEQTTEICVFCHTPHGASSEAGASLNAPLWNRSLSTARYILYDQIWSTSFEAYEVSPPKPNAPTGYSRLCLSCHDGTIALGTVINPPGAGSVSGWLSTSPGTMSAGSGATTGDTRLVGTNLQNDHPISFVYDSALVFRDEELVDPGHPLIPPAKVSDPTPISPLKRFPGSDLGRFDSVQCTSCHNPHAATYPKFLRTSYYNNDPADPNYPTASKIICLYCHEKPGWNGSAHDVDVFVPPPTPTASNPYNYDGQHSVGQYACRACHDPHTVQGAKRLLREGVDYSNNFAIENTCYLCHKPASELGNPVNPPPDIRSEFYKDAKLGMGGTGSAMNVTMSQGHEPVFTGRPQEGVELWSPLPPVFNEQAPGTTILDTVHVECVDCHNPHQVTRTNRFKGMKGIDINGNVVGAKVPGNSREPYIYEVCLRCHGNSYTNLFVGNRVPDDCGLVTPTSPSNCYRSAPQGATGNDFSFKGYSNKRKEFDPNTPDLDLPGDVIPSHTKQNKNPSFHPVAAAGRNGTRQLCKQLAVAFNIYESTVNPTGTRGNCDSDPAGALRNITIQCTDCHNNNTSGIGDVLGTVTGLPDGSSYRRITDLPSNISELTANESTKPQGPHGSVYKRILRNEYNTDLLSRTIVNFRNDGRNSSFAVSRFQLCFQCHDRRAFDSYAGASPGDSSWTNFFGNPGDVRSSWDYNLHMYHLRLSGSYCHECHNNVHSNIDAVNTIYGDGTGRVYPDCDAGGCLPPDEEDGIVDGVVDTHLLNFAPGIVTGQTGYKPRWYYSVEVSGGTTYQLFRCDLKCHNVNMATCHYKPTPGKANSIFGSTALARWCAGSGNWTVSPD